MTINVSTPPCVFDVEGNQFQLSSERWQLNKSQYHILCRYLAIPLVEDNDTLWLGVESLENLQAVEIFSFLTAKTIEPVELCHEQLKALLQQLQTPQDGITLDTFYEPISPSPLSGGYSVEEEQKDGIILWLNQCFEDALKQRASDIHFNPQANNLMVYFRIDGTLALYKKMPANSISRILSRLKLLAKLDISESRLPQDGHFQFKTPLSDYLEFRLSSLPTQFGEKIVLRLQHNTPIFTDFSQLGMTEPQCTLFEWALRQPQGLILVTGPTGSGKSISLYSALARLNDGEKNILTAEDPIEVILPGITQSQINPAIQLSFARLLRTFLRQDPDIIMLGEIRDEESAKIALHAAQTGHLVLSTLHTNDAPSAIARLKQLGISQYELDHALLLIIAQRLVKRICPHCQKSSHKMKNCKCHNGYKGRIGIFQFLRPLPDEKEGAVYIDFPHLRESGLLKVQKGITDNDEIYRVLGNDYEDSATFA
ncbi:protein transporter HofB [Actinobacillus delphinicola]|uniref:GspE/PulE family protein n=1 Tax=Actinobacillus delphinicola TaxID=51161 RepID=UPI002441EE27|nr:GspE/PulE family protein [Actinobacillus delphinicola]MDG6897562.1 protein transporter HofB [Actinobacillus delphinicola]